MPLTPFIGQVAAVPFSFAPRGWLPCDGGLVSTATYRDLYKVIGNAFGGDANNFMLPDMRGRIPMQMGRGYAFAQQVGTDRETLQPAHMPKHQHGIRAYSHAGNSAFPVGAVNATSDSADLQYLVKEKWTSICDFTSLVVLGGGTGAAYQPHENMPPCLALHFVIAWQGLFPSRA